MNYLSRMQFQLPIWTGNGRAADAAIMAYTIYAIIVNDVHTSLAASGCCSISNRTSGLCDLWGILYPAIIQDVIRADGATYFDMRRCVQVVQQLSKNGRMRTIALRVLVTYCRCVEDLVPTFFLVFFFSFY